MTGSVAGFFELDSLDAKCSKYIGQPCTKTPCVLLTTSRETETGSSFVSATMNPGH